MNNITQNNPLSISHANLYEALKMLRDELHKTKDFKKKSVHDKFSLLIADAQASKAIYYADELLK